MRIAPWCVWSFSLCSFSLFLHSTTEDAGRRREDGNTTHPIAMAPVNPAAFITQDDDIVSFISLATARFFVDLQLHKL